MPKGKTQRVKDRLLTVEQMLLNHYTDAMVKRLAAKQFDCSPRTVEGYIAEVREKWTDEAEAARPHAKAAAINRAFRLARELRGSPSEVLKVEKFLSELEGTKAPLQVENETSIELDSHSHEALNAVAQALGVPLEKLTSSEDKD